MTNEEAYNIIEQLHADSDSKPAQLAYIFAMEDLVHHDVEQWVDLSPVILMEDFMTHAETVMTGFIEDKYSYTPDTVDALNDLKRRLLDTTKAMILYTGYWWAVKEKVGNG
jgi:hypothetical protein